MNRARLERQERATERRKNSSCLLIQAKWRSYLTRNRVRATIFQRWKRKIHDVSLMNALIQDGDIFNVPLSLLRSLLHEYLFTRPVSINPLEDLEKMCGFLLNSLIRPQSGVYFSNLTDLDKVSWVFQLVKFIHLCLMALRRCGDSAADLEHTKALVEFVFLGELDTGLGKIARELRRVLSTRVGKMSKEDVLLIERQF